MRVRAALLPCLLAACAVARSADSAQSARVGDLVWAESFCPSPDCDTAAYAPYRAASTSPLLVIGVKGISGDTLYRVAGSYGIRGWLARKDILRSAPSRLSGRHETLDTLALEDPHPLRRSAPANPPSKSPAQSPAQSSAISPAKPPVFPDGLRDADIRGLAAPPFLDPDTAAFPARGYWHVTDDSRRPSAWRREKIAGGGLAALYRGQGKGARTPVFAALRTGLLAFSWKPGRHFLVRMVSATADTSTPKQEDILHLGDVQSADLDGDGFPEWVVEIRRTYGDGAYRQLAVFSMGKTLHHLVVALDGWGGEPGTSTVEGVWWIGPGSGRGAGRRIFLAAAEVPGEGEAGDTGAKAGSAPLEITTIEAGPDGRLREGRAATYRGMFLGGPMPKAAAERAAHRLRENRTAPASAPLQALPWRDGKDILWRPGLILPGAALPEGATGPDSAQVVELPRRN